MLIGLTGTFCSGKDEIADYLVKKYGFESIGTGDIVREYITNLNLPKTRDIQRDMGNKLRAENGSTFLVQSAISRLSGQNKVITGIRDVDEAEFFKGKQNTYLIAVSAPIKTRFKRMQARGRGDDPKTLDEFRQKEEKEMGSGRREDRKLQNILYCLKIADYTIDNSGSIEDLRSKIDKLMKQISFR